MYDINNKLIEVCNQNNIPLSIVKSLVSKGADVTQQSGGGWSALLFACNCRNNFEVIKYLVENGADVNIKSTSGNTPLYRVFRNQDTELFKYLIDKGANIEHICKMCKDILIIRYDFQKIIMEQNRSNIHFFKKYNVKIDPRIKKEYPEESISDELGFFENIDHGGEKMIKKRELREKQERLNDKLFIACKNNDLESIK